MIRARRGVVSNASPWDTLALLPPGSINARWRQQRASTPACASFLHLHMGLRGEGLEDLPVHHVWVGDWERGIGAERNMLVLSMPSLLDPSLAPEGHHGLHGYTPANEPWELWRDLEPGTEAYESLKRERCALFRQVLGGIVPDLEERLVIELHGTPAPISASCGCIRAAMAPPWGPTRVSSPPDPPRSRGSASAERACFLASACRRWPSAGRWPPMASFPSPSTGLCWRTLNCSGPEPRARTLPPVRQISGC